MYFIELIAKKFLKKKEKNNPQINLTEEDLLQQEYENCEHMFMPIDSTHETLACAKCGLVIKKEQLKRKNFFENNGE